MFRDRRDAGAQLAAKLTAYAGDAGLVLGIPRGGVVVAAVVAEKLGWPLDVLVARKIGAPHNSELAIGAVMPDGAAVLDEKMVQAYAIGADYLSRAIAQERRCLRERLLSYRGARAYPAVAGRTVLLVDDGMATGYTMRAAVTWLATQRPAAVVVAVPVAPPEVVAALAPRVRAVVTVAQPEPFYAVGMYYEDFSQTSDAQVVDVLQRQSADEPPLGIV